MAEQRLRAGAQRCIAREDDIASRRASDV